MGIKIDVHELFVIILVVKYFALLFLAGFGALAYLRFEQPQVWNEYLNAWKAPKDNTSGTGANGSPTNGPPTTSEVISPNSTNYINPDHVKPVEQPEQAPPPPKTPATNAPSASVAPSPKVFIPPDPLPAQLNWTWTVVGKDYHNVVVTKVEADCVHIIYDGGLGSLNLSDLSPNLQKMCNYDPELAAAAIKQRAIARAKIDAEQAPLIAAEMQKEKAQADAQHLPPAPQGLSSTQGAAIQSQIATLQSQIASLQSEAQNLDAREVADFNSPSNIYYNSTGKLEHYHTMGQSQQAASDRAQVQALQIQITKLQ